MGVHRPARLLVGCTEWILPEDETFTQILINAESDRKVIVPVTVGLVKHNSPVCASCVSISGHKRAMSRKRLRQGKAQSRENIKKHQWTKLYIEQFEVCTTLLLVRC